MSVSPAAIDAQTRKQPLKVLAVVVTWNRKVLLERCLRAIQAQTRAVDGIILIDNGSTDGTPEYLKAAGLIPSPTILYLRSPTNDGPAAGFAGGCDAAMKQGCDFIWIMDDDVIPDFDALEHLISAYEENFADPKSVGFLASIVVAPDGNPMNVPEVDFRPLPNGYPGWNQLLDKGMVKIRQATFVSVLFPGTTIEDFGLPKKEFYMWGEDSDYTLAVSLERPCYQVGNSCVTHCRASSAAPSAQRETNPARIPLLYYFYRNQIYLRRRYYRRRQLINELIASARAVWFVLTSRPFIASRARAVICGVIAGFFFDPAPHSSDCVVPTPITDPLGVEPEQDPATWRPTDKQPHAAQHVWRDQQDRRSPTAGLHQEVGGSRSIPIVPRES
jgi:GT2 family glycosyltransferase